MKKDKDIHCNLCRKSFSDHEFKSHLWSKHFPKEKFVCFKCDTIFTYSNDLFDHLFKNHFHPNETLELKDFSPKNIFEDCKDVIRHSKESKEWFRYAFHYGFEDPLNEKQLKSRVKDLYSEHCESLQENINVCKFCDSKKISLYCYFCGENFDKICFLKCHILNVHLIMPNTLKTVTNFCDVCYKLFRSKEFLHEHRKESHREEKRREKTSPFCQYCGKCLANKSNLKRHVLNQHSEKVGATLVNNVFTCHYCKCFFSNKSSVKRHIENLHLKDKDTRKSISCYQCEQRFNSIKNLNAHLNIEHNIKIAETKIQFANISEFWNWKQEEEIQTDARFIQLRGLRRQRRKGEEISTLKFVCNRSGIFHSKSSGKRAYRIKGSSKIGRYCSAYIEIVFKDNASVDGTYCSTHSGHDNDIRYLALTMDEKREIYEKIKSGTTFTAILNEIRNSVGKEIKRKHLVTNKDLHNIVTTFKKLTKENAESPANNESLSNDEHAYSDIDLSSDRSADRGFNNDLDICADLWVETCQRMINHFDHNQPKISTMPDIDLKDTLGVKTVINATKNEFQDEVRFKSARTHYSNDYSQSSVFAANLSAYPSVVQPMSGTSNSWSKQQYYLSYHGQELDSQFGSVDSTSSYQNNMSHSPPTAIRKDVPNFGGLQNMLNNVRMNKDFHSADPSVPTTNENVGILSSDIVKTSSVGSNEFCVLQPSIVDNTDSAGSGCEKTNTCGTTATNTCQHLCMITKSVGTLGDDLLLCPGKLDDSNVDDSKLSYDGIDDSKSEQLKSKIENENNSGISDLRDRINSVTALYNIVESELDERKKKIIRNYVDNMFRVLQYRYNKCKTKKKTNAKQQKPHSLAQRRFNRRRGNVANQLRKSDKQKTKETNSSKNSVSYPVATPSTHFSSKNIDPYENGFSNMVASNLKPDINLMRWDQY